MEDKEMLKIGDQVGIKPASGYETHGIVIRMERFYGFFEREVVTSCRWGDPQVDVTVRTDDQGVASREADRLWRC